MPAEEKQTNSDSQPLVYLETNVLQGLLSRRSNEDIVFVERIRSAGWKCYTSIHTLMELLDLSKDRKFLMKSILERWMDVNTFLNERRSKNLNKTDLEEIATDLNNLFTTNSFIEFININQDIDWDLVKKIGETSNLHSSDVIHLVTAWVGNCRILVTHDDQLIKEGNAILKEEGVSDRLRVCNTKDAQNALEEMLGKSVK